jgi:uncharacterized protein (TIGR02301 family)
MRHLRPPSAERCPGREDHRGRRALRLVCGLVVAATVHVRAAPAQSPTTPPVAPLPPEISDARPYDDKLIRLSVVIGAVHYLRELCGGSDGAVWRDRMREIIETDKGSALRRVKLTKSFNHGYRSYRRTYQTCSGPAQATLTKFLSEGAELSDLLLRETQ